MKNQFCYYMVIAMLFSLICLSSCSEDMAARLPIKTKAAVATPAPSNIVDADEYDSMECIHSEVDTTVMPFSAEGWYDEHAYAEL